MRIPANGVLLLLLPMIATSTELYLKETFRRLDALDARSNTLACEYDEIKHRFEELESRLENVCHWVMVFGVGLNTTDVRVFVEATTHDDFDPCTFCRPTGDGDDCIAEEFECDDMGRCHHPLATATQIHDCEVEKLVGRDLRMLARRTSDQIRELQTEIERLDIKFTTSIRWIVLIGSLTAVVGAALLCVKKH